MNRKEETVCYLTEYFAIKREASKERTLTNCNWKFKTRYGKTVNVKKNRYSKLIHKWQVLSRLNTKVRFIGLIYEGFET